jgi:hypothetical protein
MKKKVMISQPMNGLSDEEIMQNRYDANMRLYKQDYEVVNSFFTEEEYSDENLKAKGVKQIGVYFLAKSLESMSLCDAVYFCKGWEKARGCKLEHDAAVAYGLEILYEE